MSSRPFLSEIPSPATPRAALRPVATDLQAQPNARLALPFDASACTTARHWTTLTLRDLDVPSADVCEDAELIVTELVSNAVLHGAAPVAVEISYVAAVLEVSVTDGGGPPYLFGSLPHDATATRGRGLAIVATLTPAWGVRALRPGPGKTVWCRLRDAATDR